VTTLPSRLALGVTWAALFATAALSAEKSLAEIREQNGSAVVFLSTRITRPSGEVRESTGTGFLLTSGGYVLTASHVLSEDGAYDKYSVMGSPLTRYGHLWPLDVIRDDPKADLLLLKFKQVGVAWSSVVPGAPEATKDGSPLYVLGFPLEFDLGPKGGDLSNKSGPGGSWITNVPLNLGDSGAPVFDTSGRVVAMVVSGIEGKRIAFCVPLNYAATELNIAGVRLPEATAVIVSPKERRFLTQRAIALLLGFDGAFAIAHALAGQPIAHDQARLRELLRQLEITDVVFPDEPVGKSGDGLPASTFAQHVTGTLEARDPRLAKAFLVGWLGVITLNTPELTPGGFQLRTFAHEAGFVDAAERSDTDYLELLVAEARKVRGS
jgi:Trypsin-like peptidase domain